MQNSRVRVSTPPNIELMSCPSCRHKQSVNNNECEACGIIFSKYMNYAPVKSRLNRFLSPSEISDIRDTQDRFTKIKHDMESKVELIIHCHKEKLLDLAAHHLKKENDKAGMNVIKKLVSANYKDTENSGLKKFIDTVSRPSIMIPLVLLMLLMLITLVLRKSIY